MVRRALVLGGGGVTGIGWEWGMLAGLAARGVDLATADLVVGTSAGSVVGTLVAAGMDVERRYQGQLAPPDGEVAAAFGPSAILRYTMASMGSRSPQRFRARLGRLALRARTPPESQRVEVIAGRLPVRDWPDRRLWLTAVDADTGEFRVFDRDSGVPIVLAVAASCAVPLVWPPVTIDGRRYIDGGVRSSVNADLAAGYDRVVVLAPLIRGFGPVLRTTAQIETLTALSKVALVSPDRTALRAIGRNVLDPARRAAAARAGRAQASAVLDQVRAVWGG